MRLSAHQAMAHETVPTSPIPGVVPQLVSLLHLDLDHTPYVLYGVKYIDPVSLALQFLPPAHMATRPPSFANALPSSNLDGHATRPTYQTPTAPATAPASRGRGGGAGKRRRQHSTSASDDGSDWAGHPPSNHHHSNQSTPKDGSVNK